MKLSRLVLASACFLFFSGPLLAATIVEVTKDYSSVPITVDTTKNVYTVTGTVPDSGNYYYEYSGYRCLRQSNPDLVGVNAVIFHAGISGGSDIYCYPSS